MDTGRCSKTLTLARGHVQLHCSKPYSTISGFDKTRLEQQTEALYYALSALSGESDRLTGQWAIYLQALRSVLATSYPELTPTHVVWTSGCSIEWILRGPGIYQPALLTPHPPLTESSNSALPSPT